MRRPLLPLNGFTYYGHAHYGHTYYGYRCDALFCPSVNVMVFDHRPNEAGPDDEGPIRDEDPCIGELPNLAPTLTLTLGLTLALTLALALALALTLTLPLPLPLTLV